MFIGHYAVALAAKKAAPKTSLGTLFLSAQFLDLLWPIFLLSGWEHVRIDPGNTAFTPLDFYDYPITHSLIMAIVWSLAFGLIYFFRRHYMRGAWILGFGVFSHWLLDFIAHRPDLPIFPGSGTNAGLGLWNSVPATILVESTLFIVGLILYLRATTARDHIGRNAFWAFIAFTALFYVGNVFSRQQPPSNVTVLAVGGLSQWLIVPWTYWIDRHRQYATDAMALAAP